MDSGVLHEKCTVHLNLNIVHLPVRPKVDVVWEADYAGVDDSSHLQADEVYSGVAVVVYAVVAVAAGATEEFLDFLQVAGAVG